MGKTSSTRQTIIDTALAQSIKIGLEGISLGNVANDVGMSKSGLFAHFNSKEDLQLTILEEAIERFIHSVVEPSQKKPEGLARLRAYFENYLDWIAGKHQVEACPFVVFVQEFDKRPGPIREILVTSQKEWRTLLAGSARVGQTTGEIDRSAEPMQIAFETIGIALSFQVSINLLSTRGSRAHARAAFNHITK